MTPDEAISRLKAIINDLEGGGLAPVLLTAAVEATSMIRNRVTETGYDAEGALYDPYSTTPMLANCSSMSVEACKKVAGSKEKRKGLQWVTLERRNANNKRIRVFELAGGYAEFRELHGKQTSFVDFSFSGDMWKNIKVTSSDADHRNGIATISADNSVDLAKLQGNVDRRGEILALSPDELTEVNELVQDGVRQIIAKYWP